MIRSLNFLESSLRTPRVVIPLALSILAIYLAPLLIYGQDLYFLIFDNLDSNVVWFKILAESGKIFADSNEIILNMMGGLPRHTYGSEFNVILWLYCFFTPITVNIINEITMHLVAFGAMWIFLSRYIVKSSRKNMIYIATGSLYFALLPFWPSGGLSVPAMPLVVYALLNIRARISSWKDWLVLILIPFYSSLVLVYFFFLLVAGFFWLVDSIRKHDMQWHFLGAIVFMGVVFLGIEYRLVYTTFLDTTFVSHRKEFALLFSNDFKGSYHAAGLHFLNGHTQHDKGNHYLFLLPLIILVTLLSFLRRRLSHTETFIVLGLYALAYGVDIWQMIFTTRYFFPTAVIVSLVLIWKSPISQKNLSVYFLISICISLWYGFWFNQFWGTLKPYFPFIETFNMSRFLFIQPMIWSIIATISVMIIGRKLRYSAILIVAFWLGVSYIALNNATFLRTDNHARISFKSYYSEDIFMKIDDYISKPKESYRIVSLAIDPAISLYNGFYTIDGYSTNYPLEYKHKFAKIFSKANANSLFVKQNFYEWGSKCYVVQSPLKYKTNLPYIQNFDFNTTIMYDLGAHYLITPLKIQSPYHGLSYKANFQSLSESRIKIYLYEINKD